MRKCSRAPTGARPRAQHSWVGGAPEAAWTVCDAPPCTPKDPSGRTPPGCVSHMVHPPRLSHFQSKKHTKHAWTICDVDRMSRSPPPPFPQGHPRAFAPDCTCGQGPLPANLASRPRRPHRGRAVKAPADESGHASNTGISPGVKFPSLKG